MKIQPVLGFLNTLTIGRCPLLSWILYLTHAMTALKTCSSLRTLSSSLEIMSTNWLTGSNWNSSLSITSCNHSNTWKGLIQKRRISSTLVMEFSILWLPVLQFVNLHYALLTHLPPSATYMRQWIGSALVEFGSDNGLSFIWHQTII